MKERWKKFWEFNKDKIGVAMVVTANVVVAGYVTYIIGWSKGAVEMGKFAGVDEKTQYKFFAGEEEYDEMKKMFEE